MCKANGKWSIIGNTVGKKQNLSIVEVGIFVVGLSWPGLVNWVTARKLREICTLIPSLIFIT